MVQVKICGITSLHDARACVELGVDAIGLNFWSASVRRCSEQVAQEIIGELESRVQIVGVLVDISVNDAQALRVRTGVSWLQLHGKESPETLQALLPDAYKALAVRDEGILEQARRFAGAQLLLDAYVPGQAGGTGRVANWDLVAKVAQERKVTLAGGLKPENVREAINRVRPFRVDVASGVESSPGKKDLDRVRAFVQAAREDDANT